MTEYEETQLDKAHRLLNGLIARATGGTFEEPDYHELRQHFALSNDTKGKVPDFLKRCRDLTQFWSFIKGKFSTYQERRQYLWNEMNTLIEYLETQERSPAVTPISERLLKYDSDIVHSLWQKALDRRTNDPEGAITAARSLLESVCKHILDELKIEYNNDDLPKLYNKTAESLNLAPTQHQAVIFKTILGNLQSVVNGLGNLRNQAGDAHGPGKNQTRVKPRHAELAVNLSGSMAAFLIATLEERAKTH